MSTHGAVNPAPSKLRQKAIARAGAKVTAIIGPEVEMAMTATASNPRSRPEGMPINAGTCEALDCCSTAPSKRMQVHFSDTLLM
jgi:hypothetical protein